MYTYITQRGLQNTMHGKGVEDEMGEGGGGIGDGGWGMGDGGRGTGDGGRGTGAYEMRR